MAKRLARTIQENARRPKRDRRTRIRVWKKVEQGDGGEPKGKYFKSPVTVEDIAEIKSKIVQYIFHDQKL